MKQTFCILSLEKVNCIHVCGKKSEKSLIVHSKFCSNLVRLLLKDCLES